jgi:hypothetical protein
MQSARRSDVKFTANKERAYSIWVGLFIRIAYGLARQLADD